MKTNKTFKAFKTGRVYDVEQVLYCSFEKTGHCDILQEDEHTVILVDPSRGLAYRYENKMFVNKESEVVDMYDNSRGASISLDEHNEIEKHFGINEICDAVRAINNARYEMNCIHEASDRKHELSVEISDNESLIENHFEGQ